ncbi:Methylmalonyl-CoA mutase small subunit [Acidipropionibacterium jensenii]|uniref:Methylmalonyl-CoA mutase small subunit n=1 Tax=Acidipropionibacterium jensenii TaxID=1749 RepID=A0A3S4UQA1_9ACTN|nr:methylmalonyl-CoA mutase small subunit [Acidipropionibacterium jensenii]VEI02688.1 Methylmalonyl-CoA mutase small subunit [Acidipropionibacterium jensenii]
MTDPDNPGESAVSDVPEALTLAGDFPAPSQEQWEKEVAKVFNRGRPEGKQLTFAQSLKRMEPTTVDGVQFEPMYTRDDAPESLGAPGVAPFRRGTTIKTGDIDAWDVRSLHEDPDTDFTRKAIIADLERGVTSIWLRVGADAIKPEDIAGDLKDVLLNLAKVEVSSRDDQAAAANALLDIYASSKQAPEELSFNLGIDPIGFAALNGGKADLSGLAGWVEKTKPYKNSRALVADGTIYHNAGAGDVAELAWVIATAVEYVRALVEQGVSATDAFDAINFRVTATHDQFLTIARLRALRVLWNRIGEVFEVPEDHRGARQQAVSSWRELTRDDPFVNILRGTISTFGAAVGGAEAITTLPFDGAIGLPKNQFTRRIARNTGIVLSEECNIGRVNDPAGGSFYVESLTKTLAEAAWSKFQEVEAAGGFAAYLASGKVVEELDGLNAERAKRLATRKQPITAVSEFPMIGARSVEAKPFPDAPERKGLAWHRDSEVFEALVDRAGKAAERPKVFLACLGTRRDFGAREGFSAPMWHIAGIETPEVEGGSLEEVVAAFKASGSTVADLCSNKKVYAAQGLPAVKALKEAGAKKVYLSGAFKEFGDDAAEAEQVFDGRVAMGMDVVSVLSDTLDTLGVAK